VVQVRQAGSGASPTAWASTQRQRHSLPDLLLVVFAGIGGLINPVLMQGDLNRVWEAV